MPSPDLCGANLAELDRRLRAVEPAVRFVPSRVLRRVIKRDRHLPGIGLRVPHRKSYVVCRDRLLSLAEPWELGVESLEDLPPTVILLPQPNADALADLLRPDLLTRYWQALFHSRVHCVLDKRMAEGKLDEDAVRERIRALGDAGFAEARSVLWQEHYLLAEDDRSVYMELAAVYLELLYFNPPLAPIYFPGLAPEHIQTVLAMDLDAQGLLATTRPLGAADLPKTAEINEEEEADTEEPVEEPLTAAPAAPGSFRRLMERADRAAERGNLVRSAVLRTRAAAEAPAGYAVRGRAGAQADINRLGRRLQRALRMKAAEARPLRRALPALLEPAARGIWSVEARLLYDLQKVCVDHERAIYKVDLIEWLVSLGRQPLQRPLPGQEEVLALKHLRNALRLLAAARLPDEERRRLASMLHIAIAQGEDRLRDRFRPPIREVLDEVGLQPRNLPEQVARDKLIEELLDRVIDHGHLTMGDLRDALSRNQLKLPDLGGIGEFLGGDPLIQANRFLADRLAGAYRRGEVYLRWLQRLSAASFGTRVGRFLTLYLALPFGGAVMVLKGLEEIVHLSLKLLPTEPAIHHDEVRLLNGYSFLSLGVFLLLLLHVGQFRHLVGSGLFGAFRAIWWLGIDVPLWFARLPVVRYVTASRWFQVARQYVFKPLALAAPLSLLLPACGAGPETWLAGGAILYLAAAGLLNSRLGRDLEETVADRLIHRWEQFRLDIVPGLIRLVIGVFRRAVEEVERVLYTVDEWLRFRAGDSRLSFVVKLVLGVGWFVVTYLVRVFINLFVEPTFNPIKHFPVVTVTAKLILPFIKPMALSVTLALAPAVGTAVAGLTAALVIFFLPGLAGFLVWELKENWRLYRVNRSPSLRPVLIGHHGETLAQLLRPGFHSGTIPKLYSHLRKARRRAQRAGRWSAYFKQRDALHHVEETVRHFVQREFLALLEASRREVGGMNVHEIHLSTNRVQVDLHGPGPTARLSFTELRGRLMAELVEAGWLAQVPDGGRALAGLYRLGGVDAVHDGKDSHLEPILWEQWVETWARAHG